MNVSTYRRLGEFLVEKECLTPIQLSIALADQRVTNRRLGSILIERGFCSEADVAGCLAHQYGFPLVDLSAYKPLPEALQLLKSDDALQFGALPIDLKNGRVTIVLSDPIDVIATDRLSALVKCEIEWAIAPATSLQAHVRRFYQVEDHGFNSSDEVIELPSRYLIVGPTLRMGPVVCVEAEDAHLSRRVNLIGIPESDSWAPKHREYVQSAAAANHPGVTIVHDVINFGGYDWTITPKLSGESLERVLTLRGPRTIAQAAELVAKVAEAVDALPHGMGKQSLWACPSNILLGSKGPILVPIQLLPGSYESKAAMKDVAFGESYMLGKLLQQCLAGSDSRVPALPAQMEDVLSKCLGANGFGSAIEVASALKSYNWAALCSAPVLTKENDREELLQLITYKPEKSAPFWQRWFKKGA